MSKLNNRLSEVRVARVDLRFPVVIAVTFSGIVLATCTAIGVALGVGA